MADEDEKKKVTFYRLDDLEVTAVALVDKPAIGIEFLVLKRHNPDGEPAAAGEEGSMTTKRQKAAGEGEETEQPTLSVEVLRTVKAMSGALAGFLPEDAPEGCEICATARAFQEAVGKGEEASKEETSKDEPMDFRSAWEGMVVADQMWKCFMTMETVVTNIARSDKMPEEKAGLFDTAITDFATVARELLGLTKSAPADDGDAANDPPPTDPPAPDDTKKTEPEGDPDPAHDAVVDANAATALLTAITDLVTEVQDLNARLTKVEAGGEPPEAPAADGAAGPASAKTADGDKPVTLATMTQAIQEAIAKARNPVFKSRIPDQVPPAEETEEVEKGEESAKNPFDREARRKRLAGANTQMLQALGIPVIQE